LPANTAPHTIPHTWRQNSSKARSLGDADSTPWWSIFGWYGVSKATSTRCLWRFSTRFHVGNTVGNVKYWPSWCWVGRWVAGVATFDTDGAKNFQR
jgi:hypothetical protein